MSRYFPTTAFIATQVPGHREVELWVDWIPAVDGSPHTVRRAYLDGAALVIEPAASDVDATSRRVEGLDPELVHDMVEAGLVWRLCGPSGVLARHRMEVAPAPPSCACPSMHPAAGPGSRVVPEDPEIAPPGHMERLVEFVRTAPRSTRPEGPEPDPLF